MGNSGKTQKVPKSVFPTLFGPPSWLLQVCSVGYQVIGGEVLLRLLLTMENPEVAITLLLREPPLLNSDVSTFLKRRKELGV